MKLRITLFAAIVLLGLACSSAPVKNTGGGGKQGEANTFGPWVEYSDPGLKTVTISYYTSNAVSNRLGGYFAATNIILADREPVNYHHFILPALDEKFSYRIDSEDPKVNNKGGSIKAPRNLPFNFCVYGDTRTHPELNERLCERIMTFKPDFIINTGDFVENGGKLPEWEEFFKSFESISPGTVLVPVHANHDGESEFWNKGFHLPKRDSFYYSLDLPGTKLIVLDTEADFTTNSAQYCWLTNELESGRGMWKILAFHRPPHSSSKHRSDPEIKLLAGQIVPALEKYNVNLVLNGHDHLYERYVINNIEYVTTGGGGAPFYKIEVDNPYRMKAFEDVLHFTMVEVTGKKITGRVFNDEGKQIDYFEIIE